MSHILQYQEVPLPHGTSLDMGKGSPNVLLLSCYCIPYPRSFWAALDISIFLINLRLRGSNRK